MALNLAHVHGGYQIDLRRPRDRYVKRNRAARYLSTAATSALILTAPTLLLGYCGSLIDPTATQIGLWSGFAVGAYALTEIAPSRFLTFVPEWGGYVTEDLVTGEMVTYAPGTHASHPWEQRNADKNYSMKLKTAPFAVDVQTKTAKLTVSGIFQYTFDIARLSQAIGIESTDVIAVYVAYIESFLTACLADETAENVRKSVDDINEELARVFMGVTKKGGLSVAEFEKEYGIRTTSVFVIQVKWPDDVQATRNAIDEARVIFMVIAELMGITDEELKARIQDRRVTQKAFENMLRMALAISKNAKLDINVEVIEGNIPGFAGKMFQQFMKTGKPS